MLSVIVATRESERTLVPTLAALVPAVATGLLRDVIVADANSRDATSEVADVAGCRFIASDAPTGTLLRDAVRQSKGTWLLFLRAGTAPETDWDSAVEHFIRHADMTKRPLAATFRRSGYELQPGLTGAIAALRASFARPKPDQGLLIARRLYDEIGGHAATANAEAALLRSLGRRVIVLRAAAHIAPSA